MHTIRPRLSKAVASNVPLTIRQLREAGRRLLLESWEAEDIFTLQSRANCALDVDVLLGAATGLNRVALLTESERTLDPANEAHFYELIARRAQHEPIAYLLGEREFYGRVFQVTPDVLIPRPETELLVEHTVATIVAQNVERIALVDVGTGSGAILISVLLELEALGCLQKVRPFGLDISPAALEVAKGNAASLGVRAEFLHSDLLSALPEFAGVERLVIVSNPPYIESGAALPKDVSRFEPSLALFGGEDGLSIVSELLQQSFRRLSQIPGVLLFEIGSGQSDKVVSLLPDCPAHECQVLEDLQRVRRVCVVRVGI